MSRTALLAALLLVACGKEGPPPRNLLILCVDTLRADELGAYGRAPSVTPALDALAAGSVVFERAQRARGERHEQDERERAGNWVPTGRHGGRRRRDPTGWTGWLLG